MVSPARALETAISFSAQDLAIFSEASGDRNPLPLDQEYARRTPYGQQLVFGCLGAIACLNRIHLPTSWAVSWLQVEFLRPMFLGVSYRLETSENEGHWVARLFDGTLPVVALSVKAGPCRRKHVRDSSGTSGCKRRQAAVREPDDIVPGLEISGNYATDVVALSRLGKRWTGVDPSLMAALCWSSYLVGMELPGESALFSKLVLDFDSTARCPAKFGYRAAVASVDRRFGCLRMDVSLAAGDRPIAWGQCWSYVRPTLPEIEELGSTELSSDSLAGRSVVLIGASRGLGAAMKRSLEFRGAAVYSLARSGSSGNDSRTEVGDAEDSEALRRLRERVVNEQGRLDFLICNACPPLLPLRMEANSAERIGAYINLAVSVTLTPLCAFLELLNASDGCAVIISSPAVEQPVREWPHYVAAKQAVEMLAQVASLQYPRVRTLIARPPKLLTALTNTPMGRIGASSPLAFSNRLATRLEEPLETGKAAILV